MGRTRERVLLLVGVLAGWAGWPGAAPAGVWVTLAAGLPGANAPSAEEFRFETMHGPEFVAVNRLAGGAFAEARTGGGSSFFGGLAAPVVLNLADGSAYVAAGEPPEAATTRGPKGGSAGTPASATPSGDPVPSTAALLGIDLADAAADGSRAITATVTDAAGATLGSATVTVPDGGWWVIGLTPDANVPPDPVPTPTPTPTPTPGTGNGGNGGTTPPPPPVDPTPDPGPGGAVATPEPGTLALAGLGGLAAAGWRRLRRAG